MGRTPSPQCQSRNRQTNRSAVRFLKTRPLHWSEIFRIHKMQKAPKKPVSSRHLEHTSPATIVVKLTTTLGSPACKLSPCAQVSSFSQYSFGWKLLLQKAKSNVNKTKETSNLKLLVLVGRKHMIVFVFMVKH